jgi:RNA polymerase sigma factor (sigma-70 family)
MLARDFEPILFAAHAGGEWAWARIYNDLAPVVLGYLRARGAPEPDDLLGEVFLQVVRDLASFDGDERAFRSWVFTIAHHRMLDAARHRARRPVEPAAPEDLGEAMGQGDAEQDALARMGADRVHELIGRLSPDQQSALLLRIVADLSVEEIAQAMGKRPGAIRALQRRGLANLRKEMLKQGVSR